MHQVARRQFLGTVAVGAVATAAGCTSDLEGGGGDDGTSDNGGNDQSGNGGNEQSGGEADLPVYSDWLAADRIAALEEGGFFHVDVGIVLAEWPEQALENFEVDVYVDELGLDVDDIDGILTVDRNDGGGIGPDVVMTGSFDREEVLDELTGGVVTAEYGEYDVFAGSFAIGSDAFILGDGYEELIDARNGEADRIADVDDEWDATLRNVSGAGFSSVMLEPDEAFDVMAMAMNTEGDDLSIQMYAHFPDAETAEAEREATVEEMEPEFVDQGEITDVRVEGSVVVVEAVVYDFDW